MLNITPLGREWENRHSLWLIWLLVVYKHGFLAFVSFFYIGIRARRWKWIFAGFVYLLVEGLYLIRKYVDSTPETIRDIILAVFLFSIICSWVHAFLIRDEYLQIIAKREMEKRAEKDKDFENQQNSITMEKQNKSTYETTYKGKPIFINTATESEIAEITGSNIANDIIRIRNKNGAYHSLVDVIRHIQMKPHELAKIKKHFIFSEASSISANQDEIVSTKCKGRKVDY